MLLSVFLLFLAGRTACSPAVSCLLLCKSRQPLSRISQQDVAEAKTTKGDFSAWNFPKAIVSIS